MIFSYINIDTNSRAKTNIPNIHITKLQLLSVCLSVCTLLGNAHWNVHWNCPRNVVSTVIQGYSSTLNMILSTTYDV